MSTEISFPEFIQGTKWKKYERNETGEITAFQGENEYDLHLGGGILTVTNTRTYTKEFEVDSAFSLNVNSGIMETTTHIVRWGIKDNKKRVDIDFKTGSINGIKKITFIDM